MIKKLLNIIRWVLILFLLLVLWISFGGSNDEENWRTKYYKQRALDRYNQACDKFNMTQADLNICSYKVAEEVDKEILEMTEDLEGFSLEDFKEWADEAIDQEYPCQDPVADIGMEKLVFLNIMFYCEPEIYGGSGPQNNVDPDVCKNYTDNKKRIELRESETDRIFDDNGKCLEQIDYGSIQPLSNSLFYIQKGEEYKQMIRDRKESEALIASFWRSKAGDCIRYISLHVPTKDCINQMENAGGTWLNDSIMIFNNQAIDITKPYSDEVYYTGELTFTDDNNKRDVLYLIYGHDFSHRVMNYEYGKLESVSIYYDKGDNPVLLELYKDGDLIEQSSGVHIVSGEGIE
jgi:cellulose synthase/poly-beta-1,6-N-acetylglucosamine synthase-like glycosyltransferase